MADKKLSVFSKTEDKLDSVKPRGIGLKASEWAELDLIAHELSMKPHALAMYILRDFMARWRRGEIPTETKKSLPGL